MFNLFDKSKNAGPTMNFLLTSVDAFPKERRDEVRPGQGYNFALNVVTYPGRDEPGQIGRDNGNKSSLVIAVAERPEAIVMEKAIAEDRELLEIEFADKINAQELTAEEYDNYTQFSQSLDFLETVSRNGKKAAPSTSIMELMRESMPDADQALTMSVFRSCPAMPLPANK